MEAIDDSHKSQCAMLYLLMTTNSTATKRKQLLYYDSNQPFVSNNILAVSATSAWKMLTMCMLTMCVVRQLTITLAPDLTSGSTLPKTAKSIATSLLRVNPSTERRTPWFVYLNSLTPSVRANMGIYTKAGKKVNQVSRES